MPSSLELFLGKAKALPEPRIVKDDMHGADGDDNRVMAFVPFGLEVMHDDRMTGMQVFFDVAKRGMLAYL